MNNSLYYTCRHLNSVLLCWLIVSGCDFIHVKEEKNDLQKTTPVARVYDTYLSSKDIKEVAPNNILARDSAIWVEHYVDKWVRRQLFITEALKYADANEIDIEKKVNGYRNSLLEYQFRKSYVQKHLVDSVSEAEIQAYYNEHQSSFTLKKNIIRGTYIKIPKKAPSIIGLKTLIYANSDEKKHQLASYCLRFSTLYHLNDFTWVDFDKLILGSPIADIRDKVLFLQQNTYYESKADSALYFLKIDAYKLAGDISPLEFVRENIKALIINKRKVELAQQQEHDIYKKTIEGKDFERYD